MPTILRPVPDLRARVWGGRRLGAPYGAPVGEAWIAGPSSLITDGPEAGRTLSQLAARDGAAFVGRNAGVRTGDRFPLLVKLLDPGAWLSIQVHPDDATALELEGPEALGKAEAWYVLDASPDAEVLVGAQAGVAGETIRAAIAAGNGAVGSLLARHRIRAGDAVSIPPGTLHSVGPGAFLYEVQQPSDLTYRCDDWGRPATPERPLHIQQSLASLRPASRPRIRHPQPVDRSIVVSTEHFVMERLVVGPDHPIVLDPAGASLHILTAIDGPVRLLAVTSATNRPAAAPFVLGGLETAVVPATASAYALVAPARAAVLLARVP